MSIRGERWRRFAEAVMLHIRDYMSCRLGLTRFLRVKEEINKDAMLADADTARQIAGVSISSEGEDFIIEPVELDTAVAG